MIRLYLVSFFVFFSLFVSAQCPSAPMRTVEEEAMKQTYMLVRELDLSDSAQCDTIYRLHLKLANMRRKSNTRQDELDRLLLFTSELKGILNEDQYGRFMGMQLDSLPRHHQTIYGKKSRPKGDKHPMP